MEYIDKNLIDAFGGYFSEAKNAITLGKRIEKNRFLVSFFTALSGVNYPDGLRTKVVDMFLQDLSVLGEVAEKIKSVLIDDRSDSMGLIQERKEVSQWLNIDEVCAEFNLSKGNVKSKKWRDEKGFPYHQSGVNAKLSFNRSEVEEWINQNKV